MREQAAVQVGDVEIMLAETNDGPQLAFSAMVSDQVKIVGGQVGVLDFGRLRGVRPGIARCVVHPDQLAGVMAHPEFVSVHKYSGGEPGEVGRFRNAVVFVNLDASPNVSVSDL